MRSELLRNFAIRAKQKLLGVEKKEKAKIKVISMEDDSFKEKVEYLISKGDEIFNPIHYLIDEKTMKSLKGEALERYFFEIVDKYNRFKNEIENSASC